VDLLDARVRQPERDELTDAIIGDVPADRAGALGQQLRDTRVGQRIDLQIDQSTRDHHSVEAGGVQLLQQGFRNALLPLDLLVVVAEHRPRGGGGLDQGLRVDVYR
jgi:hypothetical protein